MAEISFELRPRPPFRLDLTVWALRRRPQNALDRWEEGAYRRALWLEGELISLAVHPLGTADRPRLRISASGPGVTDALRPRLTHLLDRLLGLRLNLDEFHRAAAREPRLAPLAARFRGFHPPRFPALFESLVNAVAFQQLSMAVGVTLLNRLARAFGGGAPAAPAFPQPAHLAGLPVASLRALGFSTNKALALLSLVREGDDLERLETLDNISARQHLLALRGIGLWSAEYVLLRGLGRLDVFPSGDSGAGNRVAQWLGVPGPLGNEEVRMHLPKVAAYRGMVYFYMLLSGAAREGYVDA